MDFIEEYTINSLLCDDFIKYFNNHTEYKTQGTIAGGKIDKSIKDSIDVVFYNNSNDVTIKTFFKSLQLYVRQYVKKYFNVGHNVHTCSDHLIQYYKKGSGYKALHYERESLYTARRQLVYTLYCNTLKNGGTEFPHQKKIIHAQKGKLIIFPSDFTHLHKGIISDTQEKYIVTGWFEII